MSMSKVLIVDDFKTQQAFLKNLLAEINIDFETASSGIEALEILNRQDISLVLTDYEMPKMNGFG
jgi:CheY-like chemotaxis protein